MSSRGDSTPAETALATPPTCSGVQSWAELVVLAAAMTTLLPDTASASPVPSDCTEGLVHAVPHAAVDAPADRADRTLARPAAAAAIAATAAR
jgi:hypothetical protein